MSNLSTSEIIFSMGGFTHGCFLCLSIQFKRFHHVSLFLIAKDHFGQNFLMSMGDIQTNKSVIRPFSKSSEIHQPKSLFLWWIWTIHSLSLGRVNDETGTSPDRRRRLFDLCLRWRVPRGCLPGKCRARRTTSSRTRSRSGCRIGPTATWSSHTAWWTRFN